MRESEREVTEREVDKRRRDWESRKTERETDLKKMWVKMVSTQPIIERMLAAREKASRALFCFGSDVLALISWRERDNIGW